MHLVAGLPVGVFAFQKVHFGYILSRKFLKRYDGIFWYFTKRTKTVLLKLGTTNTPN
jgi:hypothetical protein